MGMSKDEWLDFPGIKRRYSIEEIMDMTGLPWKKDGKGYRCECPVHRGGHRTLVVTPGHPDEDGDPGVFCCYSDPKSTPKKPVGGDRVALIAHIRGTGKQWAIFKELDEKRPAGQKPDRPKGKSNNIPVPEEKPVTNRDNEGGERGFRPLPYLQHENETVQAMGFQPETAQALGIAFCPRGVHRGRIAIAIRTEDGTLAGYLSIPADTSVQLPPKWHL